MTLDKTIEAFFTQENAPIRPKPQLEVIPHPDAPLFSQPDALRRLKDLMNVLGEGESSVELLREQLRQAGLVSLWFFLKYIAGYANPFNELNDTLHMDMCNFRQRQLKPGSRSAMFIPRGHYKSTIVTEGAGAWELLRNPDLRIRITGSTAEKAQGFMHSIKAIYESNELIKWLYPGHCPNKGAARWNETEIVLPNRSKTFREASVEAGGVGAASEGHHYDLHIVDDLIGLKGLNSMRASSAEMLNARNWFWASLDTLLVSARNSRVIVVGTRYAIDDVYDDIVKRSNSITGARMEGWEPNSDGIWNVYYRMGIENGEVIFPENFTLSKYREMARDDFWTFITQVMNNPLQTGYAEFSSYKPRLCWVDFEYNRWWVHWQTDFKADLSSAPLTDFNVIQLLDPGATKKPKDARTSRTACVVLATYHTGEQFFIRVQADYLSPTEIFDLVFDNVVRYKDDLMESYIEAQGGFKLLGPLFEDEQAKRGLNANLMPYPALGDKDTRIRSNLQPFLAEEKLYVNEADYDLVMEEVRAFPQSYKKDILDAMASAIAKSIPPNSPEVTAEYMKQSMIVQAYRGQNVAGY